MKNLVQTQTILLLAFFLSLPVSIFSQEDGNEKKVTVKTIKEVDGKKVVTDTTFFVENEDDTEDIVKQFVFKSEGDSTATIRVDVDIETDEEYEWETEDGGKVVIVKKGHPGGDKDMKVEKEVIIINGDGHDEHVMAYPHGGKKKVMHFKGEDGEDEIIVVSPHGKHKVVRWTAEDGEDYEFDFDVDMENFQEDMAQLQDELKNMRFEIIDEEGNISREIIEMEHLRALEELEELDHLKNIEVIVAPPNPHAPRFENEFFYHSKGDMEVSDIELRDAGIKNQPNRLELEEIDIENEEGVIELSFVLEQEGSPKVAVYNVYGDKVFSGKPEQLNNKYDIKMDLSKKQFGIYYLQIVDGKSSKTIRLNL